MVISGDGEAVEAILKKLGQEGIEARILTVSHAFHSPLMEPMLDEFAQFVGGLTLNGPRLGLISNVTGNPATREEVVRPEYWRRHVREAVQFARGMATLRAQGYDTFIEIGPSPVLLGMGRACLPENSGLWLPSLKQGRGEWRQILESAARLFVAGAELDWEGFDRGYPRSKVSLPTYSFQRERYWVEQDPEDRRREPRARRNGSGPEVHPLLGERLRSALRDVLYECGVDLQKQKYLIDHRVYGRPVLPAAAYLEMALAAATDALGGAHELKAMAIANPLTFDEDVRTVQLIVGRGDSGSASFEIFSEDPAGKWLLHASGAIVPAETPKALSLDAARGRCGDAVAVDELYARLYGGGLEFGPEFRCIETAWRGVGEAVAHVRLSANLLSEAASYGVHPALLDAAIQVVGTAVDYSNDTGRELFLPVAVDAFRLVKQSCGPFWVHARLRPGPNTDLMAADIQFFDESGELAGEIEGFTARKAPRDVFDQVARTPSVNLDEWLYEMVWRPQVRDTIQTAEFLAAPGEIGQRVKGGLELLYVEHGIDAVREVLPALERLSLVYVTAALQRIGFSFDAGQRMPADGLAERLGVVPRHRRLFLRGILSAARLHRRTRWPVVLGPGAAVQIQGPVTQCLVLLSDSVGPERAGELHEHAATPQDCRGDAKRAALRHAQRCNPLEPFSQQQGLQGDGAGGCAGG